MPPRLPARVPSWFPTCRAVSRDTQASRAGNPRSPPPSVVRELGSRLPGFPSESLACRIAEVSTESVCHGARPQRAPPPPGLPGLGS